MASDISASGAPLPDSDVSLPTAAGGLKPRLAAAAAHLLLSCVVAAPVIALVYLGWYPVPLDRIAGVGQILLLLLMVDVTLGPLLTLVVFDRRKKSLTFDLGCIAALQLMALAYGVHAVEAGRPHYLVFVKDRFEVVSRADVRPEDRAAASSNWAARVDWFSPRIVAAEFPADPVARQALMFESLQGGRDLQHLPIQYRDLATQADRIGAKAVGLAELRELNPGRGDVLDRALAKAGRAEAELRYLPIKGPKGDAAMLVDATSGGPRGIVDMMPWR